MPSNRISEKLNSNEPVALVTGGARRIGAAVVHALHASGLNIALHYRSSRKSALSLQTELETFRPNSCMLTQGDLCDTMVPKTLIEKTIETFGRLDVLVNNASSFFPTPISVTSTNQFDNLINANFKAPYFLTQAATPILRANKGSIINISDIYADRPLPNHSVYCATKAALTSLTRSLAYELAPDIRVNAIAPGAILWPEDAADEDMQHNIIARTPLKRTGSTKDIQNAVLFLLLNADFVTGQVLQVDGGQSISA